MKRRLFGTDGVRGVANQDLTPDLARRIGLAAGRWLSQEADNPRVALMRDTRRSGPMLSAALASGLCEAGAGVVDLGVAPTGCASFLVLNSGYAMAAVVSASHNPAPDNGIKLIGPDGRKLTEEAEGWIESQLDVEPDHRPTGHSVGWIEAGSGERGRYEDWLASLVPERLDRLKVAMDCAHGAAYDCAPRVFERLGAELTVVGAEPDGMNINAEGGATKPETVQSLCRSTQADVGVAFDGDADRAVFSDSQGRLINGDRTMAVWCAHWRHAGGLEPPLVVGTVMTNGGFEKYMRLEGIELQRTDVGDKHVSARLIETRGRVGGEQSGHIIFREFLPTGDGLVTALQFCRVLKREGKRAEDVHDQYEAWPQLLVNVQVDSKEGWSQKRAVVEAVTEAETSLAGRGRLNVRPSGTQPMIRVMVEADDESLRDRVADRVVAALLEEQGGKVYSRVDLTHALGD